MTPKDKTSDVALLPYEVVERCILFIRKQRVMLDSDLAALYGVETKAFNRAIKRNLNRFPPDFMFQLTDEEFDHLRYHFGTSRWGGRRYRPYAFTEHGAIMAASVQNTPRAVQMSVFVVRAFIRLRDLLAGNKTLASKLAEHERKLITHDRQIVRIVEAIRQLTPARPSGKKKPIGFRREKE